MFGEALIKFCFLFERQGKLPRTIGFGETLPQSHHDLDPVAGRQLQELSKGVRHPLYEGAFQSVRYF